MATPGRGGGVRAPSTLGCVLARARIGIVVLAIVLIGAVVAIMVVRDDEAPQAAETARPCTGEFPAREFAGCLKSNFNAQQLKRGTDERILKSFCTDVTEKLGESVKDPLPEDYRYFGCRIVFSEDGGADAVVAWHPGSPFAEAVSIERIKWDEDQEPGVG